MEELAAIYGFEPNEEFSLLNIKIPTLSCVVAPNEVEKDYYLMSPPKSVTGRHTARRPKSRTPAGQHVSETEEIVGNVGSNALPPRTPRPSTGNRLKDRPGKAHGVITPNPPPRNNRRREMPDHRGGVHGSDISNSQPDLDAGQVPPTISDLLARTKIRCCSLLAMNSNGITAW